MAQVVMHDGDGRPYREEGSEVNVCYDGVGGCHWFKNRNQYLVKAGGGDGSALKTTIGKES